MKAKLQIALLATSAFVLLVSRRKSAIGNHINIIPAPSPIHGIGLFSLTFIPKGSRLFKTLSRSNKTIMTYYGTLINHSNNANTQILQNGKDWYQYSTKDIFPFEEITADYTIAPNFLSRDTSTFN